MEEILQHETHLHPRNFHKDCLSKLGKPIKWSIQLEASKWRQPQRKLFRSPKKHRITHYRLFLGLDEVEIITNLSHSTTQLRVWCLKWRNLLFENWFRKQQTTNFPTTLELLVPKIRNCFQKVPIPFFGSQKLGFVWFCTPPNMILPVQNDQTRTQLSRGTALLLGSIPLWICPSPRKFCQTHAGPDVGGKNTEPLLGCRAENKNAKQKW